MLENRARAAGFFAVLAAVMGLSWLWALQDVLMPINPPEWSFPSCEAAKGQQSKKSQDKQNEPSEQSIASQQTPPRDGGSNSATEGHDKYYECLIAEFTRKLAVATRWLVIATLLLFITSLGLLVLQFRDTRIIQRAYVGVKPLGIHFWDGDRTKVVGHLAYINVGNLPAKNLKNAVKIKWHHDRELEVFDPVKVLSPGIMLLPKIETERGTDFLPVEDANHLAKKEGYIYVYGRLEYDDGFGRTRWLDFCHRYPCANTELVRHHHHHNAGG